MENPKTIQSEELDPWSLFIYAMKAPMTRNRYQTRLAKFFEFIGIDSDVNVTAIPSSISLLPNGDSNIILRIKNTSNNTKESILHTIPLDLTVSFPQNTTIFGENLTLTNTKGAKTNQNYYYTVTTLPNLGLKDYLNIIVEWISPLNSIWTFLTAIGIVIVPIIIRIYNKQKQTKNDNSNYKQEKLDSRRFKGATF